MIGLALAGFVVSLVLGLAVTRGMITGAPGMDLVDLPGARKVHAKVTPLGGGVAIYAAVMTTLALVLATAWGVVHNSTIAGWLPALASVHAPGVLARAPLLGSHCRRNRANAVGFGGRLAMTVSIIGFAWSWRYSWSPGWRRSARQAAVRTGMDRLRHHGEWVVGLTNAINFLDNMDGLAGGVTVLAAVFLLR